MKKLFLCLCLSLVLVSFAKSPITVKFKEYSDNPEITGLLGILDAYQVTVTLYADSLEAKYYSLWLVTCQGDEFRRKLLGYYPIMPDSTKITITSMNRDSLNAVIHVGDICGYYPRHQVSIPTEGRLLIACNYDWNFGENDTIPLMGYSQGIHKKFKMGEGFDICGLRFSKLNPLKWKEKFNLSDYLYLEAIPVKEMNFPELN